jgi:hypothetical protein
MFFREQYRRSREIQRLRLYRAKDLIQGLARRGFAVRKITGYGGFRFPPGIAGVFGERKP